MGTQEFAGGPILLFLIYGIAISIKEEGLLRTLGMIGYVLYWVLRCYSVLVPPIIIVWIMYLVGFTHMFPNFSWLLAIFLGGCLIAAVEKWRKKRDHATRHSAPH